MSSDPPPDLVIEIDITNPSIPKLPIYAEFDVPEVWRYDGRRLEVMLLQDPRYTRANENRSLPGVTADALSELIEASKGLDDFDSINSRA